MEQEVTWMKTAHALLSQNDERWVIYCDATTQDGNEVETGFQQVFTTYLKKIL